MEKYIFSNFTLDKAITLLLIQTTFTPHIRKVPNKIAHFAGSSLAA